MRTKRGGYKQIKPRQGKPRVRLRATGINAAPREPDKVRLAAVSAPTPERAALYDWRKWGQDVLLEPLNAGLKRYTRHRAPAHLWA